MGAMHQIDSKGVECRDSLMNPRRRKFGYHHVRGGEHHQQSSLNLCFKRCKGHAASAAEHAASPKAKHLTATW